ncbi:MAG: hypothetical protein BKP49_10365 [Treponema sp. CETP13]|nr:MAG: hypothetical protein BKP49_10365 [Treponema sp. CETP13]
MQQKPLFRNIPTESQEILQSFDTLLQHIKPLSSKQLLELPHNIKALSHQLTDERSTRHTGYMNQTTLLSAYTNYFMWWNLMRLTHLFAGLPAKAFESLKENDFCLDLGSGPLTLPVALWLSRPELRKLKLTFYCVDLSTTALSLGEEIFLSVVAATNRKSPNPSDPWNIIRIKGNTDTTLNHDVSAVFCANMFNELFWNSTTPLESDAKKYANMLRRYAQKKALIMVVEPGIPRAAQFVSLLRDNFLRNEYSIISPCPHEKTCPMNGKRGNKWCHFVLSTANAPKKLQKLSDISKLSKDRATLSFIIVRPKVNSETAIATTTNNVKDTKTYIRVVSDPVRIPGKGVGRYACAPWGLTLVMEPPTSFSGSLIPVNLTTEQVYHLPIDKKTGAKILYF